MSAEADRIIRELELRPHPEGGHFREVFRDPSPALPGGNRGASTAIYYLLRRGERSHWHRVDAAEVWHFYAGAPLRLSQSADGRTAAHAMLGNDMAEGRRPMLIVPAHCWQAAETLGDYSLMGCTVAPSFEFKGFELAPPGWGPGNSSS